jgi:RNA polymerase sigma factor (TIGR02999 family)
VDESPNQITRLLHEWQAGSNCAESELFELLLPDLRRLAGHYFRRERPGHTLQPTALVNEAFLRLATAKGVDFRDRGHFFAVAARIMRRYLIDHSRARPDAPVVPLEGLPEQVRSDRSPVEMAIAIDALLDELARESSTRRSVVELKFYLGMTDDEAAEALGLSVRMMQREWYMGRRWLFERLSAEACKKNPNTKSHS